jgi:hypothetical protein
MNICGVLARQFGESTPIIWEEKIGIELSGNPDNCAAAVSPQLHSRFKFPFFSFETKVSQDYF